MALRHNLGEVVGQPLSVSGLEGRDVDFYCNNASQGHLKEGLTDNERVGTDLIRVYNLPKRHVSVLK